jgi:hypothetical protein
MGAIILEGVLSLEYTVTMAVQQEFSAFKPRL